MNLSDGTRAYLYRILLALAVLALIYGLATEEQIAGWVGLGVALLGNGLATANTTRKPGRYEKV